MVAAFERAQLMGKCWSRCVGSLFVKNMTIGIATSLRTTPQNGHTLDGMRRSTPIGASVKLAVIDALKRCNLRG
jgi:hypothetical protein